MKKEILRYLDRLLALSNEDATVKNKIRYLYDRLLNDTISSMESTELISIISADIAVDDMGNPVGDTILIEDMIDWILDWILETYNLRDDGYQKE